MADPLTNDDVELLLELRESGSLSPEETRDIDNMLSQWEEQVAGPSADDLAIQAFGGDAEAAQQLATAAYEETVRGGASLIYGGLNTTLGLAKMPLLFAKSLLDDTQLFGMAATVNKAVNTVDDIITANKQQQAEWMQKNFGTTDASFVPYLIGEGIPFMFGPLGVLSRSSTFLRATAKGGVEAGLATGAVLAQDADTFEDISGDMIVGSLFGLGVSGGFQAIPGIRAYTGRQLSQEFDTQLSRSRLELERRVQEMTGDPEFAFSISQIAADNPWLVGLERGSAGRASIDAQNARIQTLVDFLQTRSSNMSPEQMVTDLHNTFTSVGRELNGIARQRYGNNMNTILNQYGDQLVMTGPNANAYLDDLDSFIGELGDLRKVNAFDPRAMIRHRDYVASRVRPFRLERRAEKKGGFSYIVRDARGEVEDAVFSGEGAQQKAAEYLFSSNQNLGGLRSDDVIEILKGHNELISGEASAFTNAASGSSEHVGRRLMASMMSAIDSADAPALRAISDARNAFAMEMQKVRTLKDSVVGQLFGDNFAQTTLLNPDQAIGRIMQLGPDGLRQVRQILETYDPASLQNLRRGVVRRAMQQSRDVGTTPALNETVVDALARNLAGRGRDSNVGRLGLGLFTPGEQQDIIRAADAARTLTTTFTRDVAKDTPGTLSDLTINAISQSAEFMGRFLARVLSKGKTVEQFMIDPRAREALIALGQRGPDSQVGRAAITYLAIAAGQIEGQENQEAREQIVREQQIMPELRQ
jgi:hypothetical protein